MSRRGQLDISDLYTSKELADRAEVTYRQIDYWTRKGFLHPRYKKGPMAEGSGNIRYFDVLDVLRAHVLGRASEAGVKPYALMTPSASMTSNLEKLIATLIDLRDKAKAGYL